MQKSVIVPIDRYERLTSKIKQTQDSWTQTDSSPRASDKILEKGEIRGEGETEGPLFVEKKGEIRGEGETNDSLSVERESEVKKRKKRRAIPPGKRSIRSAWIALNG